MTGQQPGTYEIFRNVHLHWLIWQPDNGDNLTHAVRAVVEKEQRISLFDAPVVTIDNDGLQEFVGFLVVVPLLDCLEDVCGLFTYAINKAFDSNFDALPTLVTIHGIVAADYSSQFTVRFFLHKQKQIFGVALRRRGSGVTSVTKEVNISVGDTRFLGCLEEGFEMADMRVNTSIRNLSSMASKIVARTPMYTYQTEEMKTAITLFSPFRALEDIFVLVELSLFNRHVNPDNVLPDDPASANVEVSIHSGFSELRSH